MRRLGSWSWLGANAAFAAALVAVLPRNVRAEFDLGALSRTAERSPPEVMPRVLRDSVSVVVDLPRGVPAPEGFISIANGLGVLDLDAGRLRALSRERPELRLEWSPSRRLLMDRADEFAHVSSFRNDTGLTGRGVVVGIVDSGIDPTHPDLRGENGASRI
ncbi:MAG TPA: hypothetical protein VF103_14535, partial [Polyangiaceae bacterium]